MSDQRQRAQRRMALFVLASAFVISTLAISGCGKKGDPLPPLRYVPATIQDLSIHQQGNLLIFQMGYPQTTSTGLVLPGIDAVDIYELRVKIPNPEQIPEIDPRMFNGAERLVSLTGPELVAAIAGDRFEAKLPLTDIPDDPELYAFGVRTVSSSGEVSDVSNLVQLVLRQPAPPPGSFETSATANGVLLTWEKPNTQIAGYHVYKREATSRAFGLPLQRVSPDRTEYLDSEAEFGKAYIYTIRGIISAQPLIESSPAAEREIDFRDRFAPEPPVRVLALGEAGQARLVWEESPSKDTIGYKVYRQDTPESDFRSITETPVDALEYIDLGLASGVRFLYRVSAVDGVGNEGPPSESVAAVVE